MGIMDDGFRTPDLALASYLTAIGRRLLKIDGPPGRRQFVFLDATETDVSDFLSGKAIDGRRLLDAHRTLKGLLIAQGDRR
jgi:hypothetical protein